MRLSHVVVCLCVCSVGSYCLAKEKKKKAPAAPTSPQNPFSITATPADRIKTLKDFKVELLYTVPKDEQGSWVNLCADPRGRQRDPGALRGHGRAINSLRRPGDARESASRT